MPKFPNPMHVLLRARVPDGIMAFCECGRLLGILKHPYNETAMEDLFQAHRLHVRTALEIPCAWRQGSTTQATEPVDPMNK